MGPARDCQLDSRKQFKGYLSKWAIPNFGNLHRKDRNSRLKPWLSKLICLLWCIDVSLAFEMMLSFWDSQNFDPEARIRHGLLLDLAHSGRSPLSWGSCGNSDLQNCIWRTGCLRHCDRTVDCGQDSRYHEKEGVVKKKKKMLEGHLHSCWLCICYEMMPLRKGVTRQVHAN